MIEDQAPSNRSRIIVFLRHGESDKNAAGIISSDVEAHPLTERGRGMAMAAAAELDNLPRVDALYASPVLRARQTAEIVGSRIGLQPVIDQRLRERNFGSLEEKREPEGEKEWKLDRSYGMDTWEDLKGRMVSFMDQAGPGISVAVTHGDNMSAACDVIDGMGEAAHIKAPGMCRFVIIDLDRRSILCNDVSGIDGSLLSGMQL